MMMVASFSINGQIAGHKRSVVAPVFFFQAALCPKRQCNFAGPGHHGNHHIFRGVTFEWGVLGEGAPFRGVEKINSCFALIDFCFRKLSVLPLGTLGKTG